MIKKPLPASFSVSDISVGSNVNDNFVITLEDMSSFSIISGDYNPLHIDNKFAIDKGFEGVVVYGGLIIAKISKLIGMKLPGRDSIWSTISMQFRQPLYIGETANISGVVSSISISTSMIELDISVRVGARLIAKGQAEVLIVTK